MLLYNRLPKHLLLRLWQIVPSVADVFSSVSVVQWANALSEPQCAARPDWLETSDSLGSIPGRGVGFLVRWSNSGHAMSSISRTVTEGLPVSSLNCDWFRRDTRKWSDDY